MSYTILQSTKVFRVVDTNGNAAYISGTVSEDNNVSPKHYNTIYFHLASKDILTAIQEAVDYANSVISGGIQLKNGSGKTKVDDIDTVVRRFTRNVRLAKTIEVESVNFVDGKVQITWGTDGFNKLSDYEKTFSFYHSQCETLTLRVADFSDDKQSELNFINSNRGVQQAVAVSETNGYIGAFFSPQEITKEQLTILIKNCREWVYSEIASNTNTRLTSAELENIITNEQKKDSYALQCFRGYASCLVNDKHNPITIENVKAKLADIAIVDTEGDWYRTILVYLSNKANDREPHLIDEIIEEVNDYGKTGIWVYGQRVKFEKKHEQH